MSEERQPVGPADEDEDRDELEDQLGDLADEAEGDQPDAAELETPPDQQQRQQPRGRRPAAERWRDEATRTAEEFRRYREDTDRRLNELQGRFATDPAAQARAEAEERQHVANLPSEEQARYWYDKGMRQTQQALAASEFRMADAADRRAFDAACRDDPEMRRLAPEVERLIADERAKGNWRVDRDTTFTFLYGKEMRDRRRVAETRSRRQAGARVAAQTTRPAAGASDAGGARRTGGNERQRREDLLRNTRIE